MTGGLEDTHVAIACDSELYDPVTDAWSRTGALNSGRQGHSAALLSNGDVLIVGGATARTTFSDRAEVYDSSSKNWEPTGALSVTRSGQQGIALTNGTVLVAGGFNGFQDLFGSSELFDPASATWRQTGSMNIPRSAGTTTLLANSQSNPLGVRRQAHTATLFPNGKVLVAGGTSFANTHAARTRRPAHSDREQISSAHRSGVGMCRSRWNFDAIQLRRRSQRPKPDELRVVLCGSCPP